VRSLGFPPIGIMSLSAVLKRAGHECVMFDQANPETPNDVIIEEIRRHESRWRGCAASAASTR
jgi:anaerobic magnesium-protoporphyrin IX monomethyl ester cyclase